jgi:hypothetical protein
MKGNRTNGGLRPVVCERVREREREKCVIADALTVMRICRLCQTASKCQPPRPTSNVQLTSGHYRAFLFFSLSPSFPDARVTALNIESFFSFSLLNCRNNVHAVPSCHWVETRPLPPSLPMYMHVLLIAGIYHVQLGRPYWFDVHVRVMTICAPRIGLDLERWGGEGEDTRRSATRREGPRRGKYFRAFFHRSIWPIGCIYPIGLSAKRTTGDRGEEISVPRPASNVGNLTLQEFRYGAARG